MENRFSTENLVKSLSNYPVAKGDVAGHPFRGNQYTNGQSAELSNKASDLTVPQYRNDKGYAAIAAAHLELSLIHI